VLESALANGPDRVALRDPTSTYTYSDVWRHGAQFAGGLQSIDAASNDTILLMLDNHVDFVNATLGATFIGAIEVPVNTAYKGGVLAHVINDSRSRILVIEEHFLSRVEDVASELQWLDTIVLRRASTAEGSQTRARAGWNILSFDEIASHQEVQPIRIRPSDVLAVMYTSGTTGPSKGVILPHAHAYTDGAPRPYGGGWLDTDRDDVNYVILPLYHQAGQWGGCTQRVHRASQCLSSGSVQCVDVSRRRSTRWGISCRIRWKCCGNPTRATRAGRRCRQSA
jgi:crotonobetaine/carnitine-CoA ligase